MLSENTGGNSMKTISKHLPPLEIDVDQWRREIQTFVETTVNELNAINDQMSSCFATQGVTPPGAQAESNTATTTLPIAEPPSHPTNQNLGAFKATQTDDRLAQLREKLASKLTSSNTVESSS